MTRLGTQALTSGVTTAQPQITDSQSEDTEPAWAPDGKRIAFASVRDGNKDLYVINADGSNPMRLTDDAATDGSPRWSVDGRILFTSSRGGQTDIYVMDDRGQNVARLTTIGAGTGRDLLTGRESHSSVAVLK